MLMLYLRGPVDSARSIMSRLRMAAGAASCFVALFFGGAASAGEARCWQGYEIEAARVRDLQILLMLGSLKCRSTNSEITDRKSTRLNSCHSCAPRIPPSA